MGILSNGILRGTACALLLSASFFDVDASSQMEKLGRGLSVANAGKGTFVCWRLLGTDLPQATFTLFKNGEELAKIPGDASTCYADASGSVSDSYTLEDESGNVSRTVVTLDGHYKDNYGSAAFKTIQLERPAQLTMPDGSVCDYTPNDMSVGDLDGDGEYELVLKWDPTNSKDNANNGYTGNVYIDAYKLNGKKLWRIDLGKNIRAGAHYTQFLVYDFDGDGFAEIAMKTSDGTVDGLGNVIGDASADYRNSAGRILTGKEYLTVFRGRDGANLSTIDYVPGRDVTTLWGDTWGNRSERMLGAVAYLDGVHPSLVMTRGYYAAAYMAAFDFDGKNLKMRFLHAGDAAGKNIFGEGNHNISVGDLDGDGRDEIVFGSAAVNADGTLRYRTGFGHGDALHLSDMDPDRPGLEVFDVHEEKENAYAEEFRAPDGSVIWGTPQTGVDNGRGLAADIDSTSRGFEMWSTASGGIRTVKGELLSSVTPSINFRIYWDGDLQDELLDATGGGGSGGKLEKWNSTTKGIERILNIYKINNSTLNNYTKANPCISADLFGDWREEFIVRSATDSSIVTIVATLHETPHRVYTPMHDRHYRESVAWQNVGYNQPPHLGYYLPDNVGKNLKRPDIFVVSPRESVPASMKFVKTFEASEPDSANGGYVETEHAGFLGKAYYNFENKLGSFARYRLTSSADTAANFALVYANGGNADRRMNVRIGENVYPVRFAANGWDVWDTLLVSVRLPLGDFDVELLSTSADGGPNVCVFAFDVPTVEKFPPSDSGETSFRGNELFDRVSYDGNLGLLRVNRPGFANVSVYDVRGNLVRRHSANVLAGENFFSVGAENLPAGIYAVRVSLDSENVFMSKFVVQK